MQTMSPEQRSYFLRRLDEIVSEKIQAKAIEIFGPSGRPQQPTWGMVFEGIKAGEITLKEDKIDYTGPYLNPQDVEWPAMEAKKQAMEDYRAEMQLEKQRATDTVMLDATAQEVLTRFQGI